MKALRNAVAGILAVGVTASMAACGGGAAGSDDGTYKLGAALALSGDQASLGKDFAVFMEYGVEDANEQYADQGIEIELVTEDNAGTAEMGVSSLNKLATVEQAPLVVTGWSSAVNAMAPMAEDLGTAVLNAGANAPELDDASPLLINLYTLSNIEMTKFAGYVYDELGARTAAVVYSDNPTGTGGAEAYREAFTELGGEVEEFQGIASGSVDASSIAARVVRANPDTIHLHTLSVDGPTVIKALRNAGYEGQITTFGAYGTDGPARESSGSAADDLIYSSIANFDIEDPKVQGLIERFKEDQGRDPVGLSYAMAFYDSVFLYAKVIEKLQDTGKDVTGENIVELIGGQTYDLPIEKNVTFSETRSLAAPIRVMQIKDPNAPVVEDDVLATLE
jgi:branched-chain amino acid transport system substrate-binding protein